MSAQPITLIEAITQALASVIAASTGQPARAALPSDA